MHPPRRVRSIRHLAAAGNDTTRTGLAWAIHLLSEHPEQQQRLAADFPGLHGYAIEEVLRWSSPVLHMRRTATVDTVVGEHSISAGDKVVVWYLAADHGPAVFDDPASFDIQRPNARHHFAFGAGGPHFCLGATLARMEMRVVLDKLLAAFPGLHHRLARRAAVDVRARHQASAVRHLAVRFR